MENLDCQLSLTLMGFMSVKTVNNVLSYAQILRCQEAGYFYLVTQHLQLHGKKGALENSFSEVCLAQRKVTNLQ